MKVLKIFIILFVVANFSELKSAETNDILKNKIGKLENVEASPENEKLLEYLRIKAIKEDEELNHLVEENKHLPINL